MDSQQPMSIITTDSDQVSWFAVYAKLRKYGPILHVGSTQGSYRPYRPFRPVSVDALFTFAATAQAHKLQQLDKVQCGAVIASLEWLHPRPAKRRRVDESRATGASADDSLDSPLGLSLVGLHDYGLLNIFERMSIRDLCEVARTCVRFNGLAKAAFRVKYARFAIHLNNGWTMPAIEALFMEFGELIKWLRLDVNMVLTNLLLGFIAKFCPNIENITCCSIDAMALAIQSYEQLAPADRQGVAAPFGKLVELEIVALQHQMEITLANVHLPSLRHLILGSAGLVGRVGPFFATNNRLTMLRMDNVYSEYAHIQDILEHLVQLDELELSNCVWGDIYDVRPDMIDYGCFGRLQRLTKFSCQLPRADTESILAAMHAGNVPLKMLECIKVNGYPAIVEQMASVEELRIIDNGRMDGIDRVIAFVERRPHLQLVREEWDAGLNLFGFLKVDR